jgi:hypothetical protein
LSIRSASVLPGTFGKWHLSEDRKELDLIYRTDSTSLRDVQGMALIEGAAPSKLMARRDVSGLLHRLVTDEWLEHFLLPSFIEFLRRGGTPTDPASFNRVMADRKDSLRFPPTGDTIGSSNIEALISGFRKWDGKALPFAEFVEN